MSASSAALDLAHLSQTSPRNSFSGRAADSREKSSEWPQFKANPRVLDSATSRADRRTVTNPTLTLSSALDELSTAGKLSGTVSASATPHTSQHPLGLTHPGSSHPHSSRRGSPSGTLDTLSVSARSVPATPLGSINGSNLKTPGTPLTPDTQSFGTRVNSQGPVQGHETSVNAGDLQASLSSGQYDNGSLSFNTIQAGNDQVRLLAMPNMLPLILFPSAAV